MAQETRIEHITLDEAELLASFNQTILGVDIFFDGDSKEIQSNIPFIKDDRMIVGGFQII